MVRQKGRLRRYMGVMPKIFLYMMAFCLLLLVVLWVFQTVLLDSFYTAIKQNEVQKSAMAIAQAIAAGDDDWQTDVLHRGDVSVELYDPENGALTLPGNQAEGIVPSLKLADKQSLYEQAVENGGAVVRRQSTNVGELVREMQQELGTHPFEDIPPPEEPRDGRESGGGGQGFFAPPQREEREGIVYATLVEYEGSQQLLMVSAEITPVNATVQTLRYQLIYISIFVLALGLVLALVISRSVARPIASLTKKAARLADEEYDLHFAAEGYREIAGLADTLNHAAAELGKTEALRRELVANVSHDLRTPLTLITGYAEMMRDIPGEATAENMGVIIEESRRLTELVNELVDYSRLESGTGEMHIERVNITGETREIIERFSLLAGAEGYTVEFTHADDLYAGADAKRIAQVVYNFLSNAVAHTGPDKRILVRQREKAGRVVLEVEDTGEGIAAADLPYIWQRYYKTDGDKRAVTPGSGLGLSIAKSILDRHPNAEYGACGGKQGGSVFWFSLPISE